MYLDSHEGVNQTDMYTLPTKQSIRRHVAQSRVTGRKRIRHGVEMTDGGAYILWHCSS